MIKRHRVVALPQELHKLLVKRHRVQKLLEALMHGDLHFLACRMPLVECHDMPELMHQRRMDALRRIVIRSCDVDVISIRLRRDISLRRIAIRNLLHHSDEDRLADPELPRKLVHDTS